jgi:hypothetical protein
MKGERLRTIDSDSPSRRKDARDPALGEHDAQEFVLTGEYKL